MQAKRRYRGTWWCIGSLLLLLACSQVIDLDVNESGGQLVIFGRLTNGGDGNFVSISRTADLGNQPVPVEGATVTVISENGDREELVPGDAAGDYELLGNVIRGEEGMAYHLEVQVDGRMYHTRPQVMPRNYGRDELSFELKEIETITSAGATITENVVSVSARTEFDELPDEFYLRWDIEEAYTYLGTFLPTSRFPFTGGAVQCYVINDLNEQRIFLHNGTLNRAMSIPDRVFTERPVDKSFQSLHYFNLIRSSVSKEAYDFWSQLDAVVNRQGSIFDAPPAAIKGNILADSGDEEVLGFFELAAADTTRMALTRNDVPVFFFDECVRTGPAIFELFRVPRDCRQCLVDQGIVDAHCLYCNVLPGSSGTRPSYF